MTYAEFKKAFKDDFKFTNPKMETSEGKMIAYRDWRTDSLIKGVFTGVTLSPMDCTNVKYDKIQSVFYSVIDKLRMLGATVTHPGNSLVIMEFETARGKKTIKVSTDRFKAYAHYDEGYKHVFVMVDFE